MVKYIKNDVIDIVKGFQKRVLDKKPPLGQMFEEVQMMNFKIRPLQGDISILNLKNNHFIEILWSLGKLDEFFQDHYRKIYGRKRELFLRLFDEIHEKFQKELNALNLKPEKVIESSQMFEMEIFKERASKRN